MTRARDLGDFIADGGAPELVVDTTTLVVDSTNNRVGVGTASPATALDVVGNATITITDNSNALSLVSTDADADIGPVLEFNRNSSSPSVNDQLGRIDVVGKNDAGQDVDYVRIVNMIRDASDGSEDGRLAINTITSGALFSRLNIEPTETVFNDESYNVDFRVESNGNANMLFVDGGNDAISIGTNSPSTFSNYTNVTLQGGSAGVNLDFKDNGGNRTHAIVSTPTEFIVETGNTDPLIFKTNNSERFRIASAGQLGIAGANYGTSGQVLTSGGSSAAPTWADAGGGGGPSSYQVFTSSGTWTRPSGITKIIIEGVGAGGGGGAGEPGYAPAAGGAAGGYFRKIIDVSSISSETVTIGAAGTAGSGSGNGGTGGTTSFGSHASANGGSGGQGGGFSNRAGNGGTATGGNVNISGGAGFNAGYDNYNATAGNGGASFFGGGGRGGAYTSQAGSNAEVYGSGGGGGSTSSGGGQGGGTGQSGLIIVWEYE
tara:strand:+ start:2741 stop:4207 length:1467 start_codon:yes stop_codon:yes gene_type:complete